MQVEANIPFREGLKCTINLEVAVKEVRPFVLTKEGQVGRATSEERGL
jgi:hypothetical protein